MDGQINHSDAAAAERIELSRVGLYSIGTARSTSTVRFYRAGAVMWSGAGAAMHVGSSAPMRSGSLHLRMSTSIDPVWSTLQLGRRPLHRREPWLDRYPEPADRCRPGLDLLSGGSGLPHAAVMRSAREELIELHRGSALYPGVADCPAPHSCVLLGAADCPAPRICLLPGSSRLVRTAQLRTTRGR